MKNSGFGGYTFYSGSVISNSKTFETLFNLSRLVSLLKRASQTTFKGLTKITSVKRLAWSLYPQSIQAMVINVISIRASGPTQGGKETKVTPEGQECYDSTTGS